MSAARTLIDQAKRLAARKAVDEHIKDGQVVGVGSGSTIVFAVQRLSERVKKEGLKIVCVPTSFQAKELIVENKLQLSDLDVHSQVDVTIDGCDECDKDLNLIKGGGGCMLQEKMVASASKKLVIVADYTKKSEVLGENWTKGIPLEVSSLGWKVVQRRLLALAPKLGYTDANALLRMATRKMGPVVTDNNNFIIDFQFGATFQQHSPENIETALKRIPGILETGLFVKMADQIYFGMEDGSVNTRSKNKSSQV